MNYTESRAYAAAAGGISPGLNSIRALCAALGDPQRGLKYIHIAGTNGKGSVGAFIEAVLIDAGLKVGRYSSPAVFDYLEQFRVNGENMSERTYARYITRIREEADKMNPLPTPFEIETAAAFLYFREENCDIVLLECGMGGGGDATNIIEESLVSVITPISMDHMNFLGDTLGKIAAEKAGIIKENSVVVSALQKNEAMGVIENVCRDKNARLIISLDDGINRNISLAGAYQQDNARLAETVCRNLRGFKITEENIKNGLKNAVWHGRFEKICSNPELIIDGAHNPDAAERLMESIDLCYKNRRIIYIMGVLGDKNYKKIAEITAPRAEKIYTITPDSPRALDNAALADAVKEFNPNVEAVNMRTALRLCLDKTDAVTIAFGSLSFLGDLSRMAADMIRMKKCDNIIKHKKFRELLSKITEAEKDRIYCRHGIEHLMDTARAAYIINLENGLNIPKELIYGAALIHDLGRYAQYAENAEHHEASAALTREILPECGYSAKETEQIARAVMSHRGNDRDKPRTLAEVLTAADNRTRLCMLCGASDTCKWSEYEKNHDLII